MVKGFQCDFSEDVICPFKKNEKSNVTYKCVRCVHYKNFEREMHKEEDEFFAEVERIRKRGYM